MDKYFKTRSAAVVILMREKGGKPQILLQRRKNTGFADGLWDFSCSGHVEEGESMTSTAIREAKEELNICLKSEDLKFIVFVHKRDGRLTYYNAYFICDKFYGEPEIGEPEKCSEIAWFNLDRMPDDLIPDRKEAICAYLDGRNYIEYGWSQIAE